MAEQALVPRPAAHPVTEPEPEPRRQGPPRAGPGQALGPGTGMGNAAQARLMAEQPLAADAVSGVARDLGLGNAAIERAIAAPASELPRRAGDLATPPSTTQHPLAPDFQRLVPAPDRQPARDFQRPGASLDRRRQAPPSSNAAAGVRPRPVPLPQARMSLTRSKPSRSSKTRPRRSIPVCATRRSARSPTRWSRPRPRLLSAHRHLPRSRRSPMPGATTSGTGAEGGVTLSATDTRGNAVKATTEGEAARRRGRRRRRRSRSAGCSGGGGQAGRPAKVAQAKPPP